GEGPRAWRRLRRHGAHRLLRPGRGGRRWPRTRARAAGGRGPDLPGPPRHHELRRARPGVSASRRAGHRAPRLQRVSVDGRGILASEDRSMPRSIAVYRTELTPVDFLKRNAYVLPEKVAVVHGGRRYTYRQFEERANRLASALRRNGLRKHDRV